MIKWLFLMLLSQPETTEIDSNVCGLNQQSKALAALIINHPSQQRGQLSCNDMLADIANQRAQSLITQNADSKLTANQFVIKHGFRFASYYPITGNQVEAVAKEQKTPELAFKYLINNNKHHNHVLGKGEFFERQNQIGVGFFESELGQEQYVVLIAEPYASPKIVFKPTMNTPTMRTVTDCPRDWRRSANAELRKVCREMAQQEQAQKENND
jgi:hypothetical protein